jgi:hypothetical protein
LYLEWNGKPTIHLANWIEPAAESRVSERSRWLWLWLSIAVTAGLALYSQTRAFTWDEGFHLLAAQLMQGGKQPYLDFCFPQTPLNAYWNAAWMALTGDGWRITHLMAALLSSGSVLLAAHFVWSRFPVANWRAAGGLVAALMVGLDTQVMQFGTIAQAYGICLFFTTAAFRVACVAVERRSVWWSALSGLCAAIAAGSSLLSAPVAAVIWVWILFYDQTQRRSVKAVAFALACVVPMLPVLRLYLLGPRQVLFNLFEYHLVFRRVQWDDATRNDIDVLTSWIHSPQAMLIGGLAMGGAYCIWRSDWERADKAQFYLCAALCLALGLQQSAAHPTFSRYFVLLIPFAAILASAGLYFACARTSVSPRAGVAFAALLMSLGLARTLFDEGEDFHWKQMEAIAARVEQVTPRNASVWGDEHIYFLTRRTPPPGMEFAFGHKLSLPTDQEKLYHLISSKEVEQQLASKQYATSVSCDEEEGVEKLHLPELYGMRTKFPECSVFYKLR